MKLKFKKKDRQTEMAAGAGVTFPLPHPAPRPPGEGAKARANPTLGRVHPRELMPSKTNPRKSFNGPDWPEFVANIREHGVIQPLLVRPLGVGKEWPDGVAYEIVAGERRWRAALEAGLTEVPVLLQPFSEGEAVEVQQIENLQREDLSPLEEAHGYADWKKTLEQSGMTTQQAVEHICGRIHRKRSVIYQRLSLFRAPASVREALTSGRLDVSRAVLIAQVPDAGDQDSLLKKALEKRWNDEPNLSVRELVELIQEEYQIPLSKAEFDQALAYQGEWKSAVCKVLKGDVGPCTTCPFRTGNMVDQYPELKSRPNVCTNLVCFKAKTAAAAQMKVEAAAAKGKPVLTPAEFNKRKGEFVRGDATAHNAESHWGESWSDIMGAKKPEATLVATRDGVMKVYLKEEAVKAAQANGIKIRDNQPAQSQADREKEAVKRKAIQERREKLVKDLEPALAEKLDTLKAETACNLVRRWMDENGYDSDGRIEERLKKKTAAAVTAAIVLEQQEVVDYYGGWVKDALELWKLAGIDLPAEEQKVVSAEKVLTAKNAKGAKGKKGGK